MKKPGFALPAVALIAGAAIGFICAPAPDAAAPQDAQPQTKVVKTTLDDANTIETLRRRIKELEAKLAENADAQPAAAEPSEERAERGGRGRRRQWQWNANTLEELKKSDPEAYAQATNNIARMRQRGIEFAKAQRERAETRMAILESFDPAGMDGETRQTHEKLLGLMEKREKLAATLENAWLGEDGAQSAGTEEDRGKLFGEMWEVSREIESLNAQERDNLLQHTVKALGFTGDEAEEVAGTFKDIFSATEGGFGGRGPGGGRGGRGPGGGRGGRGQGGSGAGGRR